MSECLYRLALILPCHEYPVPLTGCKRTAIGSKVLTGDSVSIVTSLYCRNADKFISSFESGKRNVSELYELRYDLFEERSRVELGRILQYLNSRGVDYIFTHRTEDEDELLDFYGTAQDNDAPASDIEISMFESLGGKTKFSTLILSHHSYKGDSVIPFYEDIQRLKPDIIKLASSYHSYEEFQRDMAALRKFKERDGACLSFIPMGKENSFMRIISAYVISDMVYAKERGETGEGQLTKEEYEAVFRFF